jgi:hypothetical protein
VDVCNPHSRLASLGLVYELNSHARASSLVIRARHTWPDNLSRGVKRWVGRKFDNHNESLSRLKRFLATDKCTMQTHILRFAFHNAYCSDHSSRQCDWHSRVLPVLDFGSHSLSLLMENLSFLKPTLLREGDGWHTRCNWDSCAQLVQYQ